MVYCIFTLFLGFDLFSYTNDLLVHKNMYLSSQVVNGKWKGDTHYYIY